jgi:hypothetical protein
MTSLSVPVVAAGAGRVRRDGHDVFSRMRELTRLLHKWLEAEARDAGTALQG